MDDLARQLCINHAGREAAALCPECGRFFCRECVVEHDDRVLCASCLKRLLKSSGGTGSRFGFFVRTGQFLFGFLILWLFFFFLGRALLSLPSSFHEGTVWTREWWGNE
jgi:hypothetical protein